MTLRQRAIEAVVWSATRSWGERLVSFLVFLVLARLIAPEAFGLVAVARVLVGITETIVGQGLGDAIVQREEVDAEHLDAAFWMGLAAAGVLVVASVLSAGLVASAFGEPRVASLLRWMSLAVVLRALCNTQHDLLRRALRFKALAVRSLAAVAAGGVVGLVLAARGFGAWALVGQALAVGLTEVVVLWSVSAWRPGLSFSRRHIDELLSFSLPVLGTKLVSALHRRMPDIVIGVALGPIALGYYVIAFRFLRVLLAILTSVTGTIALPLFSQLQREPARLRRAYYQGVHLTSLFTVPAFLGVGAVASEVIPVLFGSEWLPSVPLMQLLALVGVLRTAMYFNGPVFKALGQPSWHFGVSLAGAMVTLVALTLAAGQGLTAVVAAQVGAAFLVAPLSFVGLRRVASIDLRTCLQAQVVPILGSLVMVAFVMMTRPLLAPVLTLELRLIALVATGALVYFAMVRVAAPTLVRDAVQLLRATAPALQYRAS